MSKPPWVRRRVSCPECGHIYAHEDGDHPPAERHIVRRTIKTPGTWALYEKHQPVSVKCPQCEVTLSWEEFWEGNHSKYDKTMGEIE